MHKSTAPIGIYDSGLGGLSVVRQLQRVLPQETFVYFADTGRVPYGGRSEAEIHEFSGQIMDFLARQDVKMILCACNTSSVVVLPTLKNYQGIDVLGLAQAGANIPQGFHRVALLATEATVRSGLYSSLIGQRFPDLEIRELACPEFVPLVEAGHWSGPEVEAVVAGRLMSLSDYQPDAVILGCSHYPYLSGVIQKVLGPGVRLLDPAEKLVQQLCYKLRREELCNPGIPDADGVDADHFYTTAATSGFKDLAEAYLEKKINHIHEVGLSANRFSLPLPNLY